MGHKNTKTKTSQPRFCHFLIFFLFVNDPIVWFDENINTKNFQNYRVDVYENGLSKKKNVFSCVLIG